MCYYISLHIRNPITALTRERAVPILCFPTICSPIINVCFLLKLLDPIRKKFQTPELQKLMKQAYPAPKKASKWTGFIKRIFMPHILCCYHFSGCFSRLGVPLYLHLDNHNTVNCYYKDSTVFSLLTSLLCSCWSPVPTKMVVTRVFITFLCYFLNFRGWKRWGKCYSRESCWSFKVGFKNWKNFVSKESEHIEFSFHFIAPFVILFEIKGPLFRAMFSAFLVRLKPFAPRSLLYTRWKFCHFFASFHYSILMQIPCT